MKTLATVIHHSADYDGIFCREIAKKFLPDAELIGWDFGDPPLPDDLLNRPLYVMDLPVDRPFGLQFKDGWICRGAEHLQPIDRWDSSNIIWIDHHKSSIDSHPVNIRGYRIDGVGACRLAWQWFKLFEPPIGSFPVPNKDDFIERRVIEPIAVRLAGEYDIWDKRDPDADLLQHGLSSKELSNHDWQMLLSNEVDETLRGTGMEQTNSELACSYLLKNASVLHYAKTKENESIIKDIGFTMKWEGLTFIACNAARYNSHLFTAGLRPEHDACFGFKFAGHCAGGVPCEKWEISLYHAPGKEHHDLSEIAKKYGGGGHRGACGFTIEKLPFLP